MTLKEAMEARHTVRRYTANPLPEELIEQLNTRITEHNTRYHLAIKLNINDTSAFPAILKLFLAKGVKNYLVLAGPDTPDLDEKLGYCSADLMLYAQTLGLNTWWVGGTFHKSRINAASGADKVIGIVAIGYGATQGTPHKSKTNADVASYQGASPSWFTDGVNAALLAPTALNKQAFFIKGAGSKVKITYKDGSFAGADLGIVKYHFELGAGTNNFQWDNDE